MLPVTNAGSYTVFLEEQSVMTGKIYSTTESVAGLRCNAERQGSGQTIVLRRPGGSMTYSVGGRSGRSVLQFDAQQLGQYVLSCAYPEERNGPEVVLAVGTGFGRRIFSLLLSSLAAILGGGIIGVILLVMGAEMESSRTRHAAGQVVKSECQLLGAKC